MASIYLASSAIWWGLFRTLKQVHVLSTPFILYGLAFFLVGMGPYTSNLASRGWIYNIATAFYAAASASGYVHPANLCIPHIFVSCVVQLVYCQRAMSPHDTTQLETTAKFTPMLTFEICSSLFFALNFGTEGGTPAQSWAFRACVIQGSQQLSVAALWYWGSALTASSNAGFSPAALFTSNPKVTGITTVIAAILWAVAAILYLGLPDYYRQQSGKIPSFYSALSVFTRVPKPLCLPLSSPVQIHEVDDCLEQLPTKSLYPYPPKSPTNAPQPRQIPPQNRNLVSPRRPPPELLALGSLRPQLALPLVLRTRTRLVHPAPTPCLLHRHLDHRTLHPRQPLRSALLAAPHLRYRYV